MPRPKPHVIICGNQRPPGHPKGCCSDRGAHEVRTRFQEEFMQRELLGRAHLSMSSCLSPCEKGPVAVVYPDGVWYGKLKPEDVPEIIESHIIDGRPVERLVIQDERL